ncbi:DUF6884 domain-containing protein [Virgibacillus flavescens]|uniref:DUF6884 domain-containing protein n=1 Tax=Virgibacillus flavescens TaxID=1611422 RepID=UPI003D356950
MNQLSIIPCGKKKVWDKFPAHGPASTMDTYIGTFHTLCRRYAMEFSNQWVVLSAKHGFLLPEDIVEENYDVTFNQKSNEIITFDQLWSQVVEKGLNQFDELVILTGKKYKKVIDGNFEKKITMKYPLADYSGMGYMQQALKSSVEKGIPLH